ncbi:hypothetical protein [Paenibacillus thalictri]|uniref:Uncharacterized protein n=1 Tax=Paenibacillus thalictri TaxID=2527873 RepID=A0A4Q9DNW3_9BACL|nr:hypothetical protein [Paenibacillus thalictri]TBL74591.1 hypothetical protein EYB31_25045 [Paenibacillus thalictri]
MKWSEADADLQAVKRFLADMSGSDLNTLLLDVFQEKIQRTKASELLKRYDLNRFVRPASLDPVALKKLELLALSIAGANKFTPLQLSPAAPLGSCSVVAAVDQNKVISALRGTEIASDPTNALALHMASLLKSGQMSNDPDDIRFCTTHRVVRAQHFGNNPRLLPHFHLFCMVTSGKDKGSYEFEASSFWEHIAVYKELFQAHLQTDVSVKLQLRGGYKNPEDLAAAIVRHGEKAAPATAIESVPGISDNAYYNGVQFTLTISAGGQSQAIGDGGFVNWTQTLLGSKKERLLISGIGLDRLVNVAAMS